MIGDSVLIVLAIEEPSRENIFVLTRMSILRVPS